MTSSLFSTLPATLSPSIRQSTVDYSYSSSEDEDEDENEDRKDERQKDMQTVSLLDKCCLIEYSCVRSGGFKGQFYYVATDSQTHKLVGSFLSLEEAYRVLHSNYGYHVFKVKERESESRHKKVKWEVPTTLEEAIKLAENIPM